MHLMYIHAMLLPRDVRAKTPSRFCFSRSEYCHSARSSRVSVNLSLASSLATSLYVGSGGRNASLAAMRPGQGGQQKRQHSSLKLNPFEHASKRLGGRGGECEGNFV